MAVVCCAHFALLLIELERSALSFDLLKYACVWGCLNRQFHLSFVKYIGCTEPGQTELMDRLLFVFPADNTMSSLNAKRKSGGNERRIIAAITA